MAPQNRGHDHDGLFPSVHAPEDWVRDGLFRCGCGQVPFGPNEEVLGEEDNDKGSELRRPTRSLGSNCGDSVLLGSWFAESRLMLSTGCGH
jgi:hypothetical protein